MDSKMARVRWRDKYLVSLNLAIGSAGGLEPTQRLLRRNGAIQWGTGHTIGVVSENRSQAVNVGPVPVANIDQPLTDRQ